GRSLQQLQEENQYLRRSIRELQRSSQADQLRVEQLTEELLQRRRREEQEAQDLESMVHSVEQNLTQMTVTARHHGRCSLETLSSGINIIHI
ncbi:endosome-associated-trafficking regulator 1, partial [Notothenia coriiceps]|uniref:Endosome-associated-trafficking regulator 1 n=1 Tax=Notothenia coriiceps TaxID=8208 RepID=A0A6I9MW57_9TELE